MTGAIVKVDAAKRLRHTALRQSAAPPAGSSEVSLWPCR